MALNPSGAISLAGPSAGQSIAVELGVSATATISLNDTNVRTLAQVPSGVIVMPTNFYGKSSFTPTQKGIFAFGTPSNPTPTVSSAYYLGNTGVFSATVTSIGPRKYQVMSANYGGDKAIFGFGYVSPSDAASSTVNLVSNTGVMASAVSYAPITRNLNQSGSAYGGDKAIFAFGSTSLGATSTQNLITNTGVVGATTNQVGTPRQNIASATYGGSNDRAIFAFGTLQPGANPTNISNLVSNTGVVASDTPGVGLTRAVLTGVGYGGDKAIFAFGFARIGPAPSFLTNISNLVSNTGVVASDTPGVGTARSSVGASAYGGDKAIFAFGNSGGSPSTAISNLVSNTGVVASDTPIALPSRSNMTGAGYSFT